jgi:hypothetical protein
MPYYPYRPPAGPIFRPAPPARKFPPLLATSTPHLCIASKAAIQYALSRRRIMQVLAHLTKAILGSP